MAIKFVDDKPKKPAKRIIESAKEAAAIAKGEKAPARTHGKEKFDRTTYQRELMRKRRAEEKARKEQL